MSAIADATGQTGARPEPGFLTVAAFVWGYWRRVPLMFGAIVGGVILSVALEVQIPERASELVAALQRHYETDAPLALAWQAMYWLIGTFAAVACR